MTHVEGGGVPAGTQLNGIYEVQKRIAIGGMGEVYVGRVIQTGDRVAIKMILPEHANNELIVDLFRREASTLHNLYHPAIVRYYVFSVDPVLNRPYLSMEFAAGPSLGERMREGPLTENEMTVLRRRIGGGLHAAHQLGIIHRDISPDNIILVDGDVEKAKIIDFGIAKSQTNEGTLIGSGFAGKLNYVSPEQLGLEGGDVTAKSDIYSLGLVFAEAVVGRPLPMGGSQVEVIEKRRSVPDLSAVPQWIRPLIESMIQPSPADRPADMQAIADWSPGAPGGRAKPAAAAAAAATPRNPIHPRERRRQNGAQPEVKKGAPWLLIGGGVGFAAAAVAAFVILGRDADDAPGPEPETASVADGGVLAPVPGGGDALAPAQDTTAGPIRVSAPAASVAAPDARAGEGYAWTSAPFGYAGDPAGLDFTTDGALPPGVSLDAAAGGAARLSGTPDKAGDYAFIVVATAPSGETARMEVRLAVAPAQLAAAPAAPSAPAGTLSQPASGDAGAPLLSPSGDGMTPAPGGASPPPPALSPAAGAGSAPILPPADTDPSVGSVEPSVATGSPGDLPAPAVEGGSSVPVSGGEAPLPRTGATQPQQPAAAGGSPAVAALPSSGNQPPTVEGAAPPPLSVAQGQQVNARLGSFFDEDGPAALSLQVEGTVPNGLAVRLAEGGVAQLYGTPAEFGEYEIRVAAVDTQGLVSQPIPVMLSIAPPAENKAVRDYILGYDGGDCFLSRPMKLGPQLAQIEVFADQEKVQPVLDFDTAFKRDMGFEASIGMRPISAQQCPLIHALDQVGPQALDNSLVIDLDRDELASGDRLSGKIAGGQGASLFLYDHLGGLTDLSPFVQTKGGETGFSVPVTATGPQILVAARPGGGAGIEAGAGLEALLGAAKRGEASLALGFFIMK